METNEEEIWMKLSTAISYLSVDIQACSPLLSCAWERETAETTGERDR